VKRTRSSHPVERKSLARRSVAELLGTAFLLGAAVGSGIMGERLAGGNVAIALLANTLATGATLVVLILTFGPISGAPMNSAVTVADASQGGTPWADAPVYIGAQIVGAFGGAAAAHLMFEEPLVFASHHGNGNARLVRRRGGLHHWLDLAHNQQDDQKRQRVQ
jgi:glycerol uptake facilitator-like aquaporin